LRGRRRPEFGASEELPSRSPKWFETITPCSRLAAAAHDAAALSREAGRIEKERCWPASIISLGVGSKFVDKVLSPSRWSWLVAYRQMVKQGVTMVRGSSQNQTICFGADYGGMKEIPRRKS